MPILPLMYTQLHFNPFVVGAWIGGCVDSTGQVIASASLGDNDGMLKAATLIKLVQNIYIGPICLLLTSYFQKSFKLQIILDKFPLFVAGFFVTSLVLNVINFSGQTSNTVTDLIITNSWFLAEWLNLVGFAIIGIQIDIKAFVKDSSNKKILIAYLIIQSIDICTTFGWAYLMFKGTALEDDDSE